MTTTSHDLRALYASIEYPVVLDGSEIVMRPGRPCAQLDRALRVTAVANRKAQSLRLDLWGASRKSALLAKIVNVPVEIVAPDGTVVMPRDDGEQAPD